MLMVASWACAVSANAAMSDTKNDFYQGMTDLENEVTEMMKKGYIPIGSPKKFPSGYYQAMYLDKSDKNVENEKVI